MEVVGESFYQDQLEALAGGRTPYSQAIDCTAVLIPYSTNPHDANAVRVEIHGLVVGHLSRSAAMAYRDQIAALGRPQGVAEAAARIVGGWDDGEDEGDFGVELKIQVPLALAG
ncbi:hypothetical protein [Caulobacter endophyticus]|uniref:HIRAN domain-containing protein n=1 Tax=Caulobacter endophyticus TaxID=2172652 RepID=A0A2T9K3Y3_9CAUL|nr:hypothetical protein [Caulobacter endophyticus]PVM90680.1 hypothetical protein DDF67_09630 [Caulobacter endophyticus]